MEDAKLIALHDEMSAKSSRGKSGLGFGGGGGGGGGGSSSGGGAPPKPGPPTNGAGGPPGHAGAPPQGGQRPPMPGMPGQMGGGMPMMGGPPPGAWGMPNPYGHHGGPPPGYMGGPPPGFPPRGYPPRPGMPMAPWGGMPGMPPYGMPMPGPPPGTLGGPPQGMPPGTPGGPPLGLPPGTPGGPPPAAPPPAPWEVSEVEKELEEKRRREREVAAAWQAHKSEEGTYFFNSITEESSWEKPEGFEEGDGAEPEEEKPVSAEPVEGTPWSEVTTNTGKKYYYRDDTQETSWAVPPEVEETRRAEEARLREEAERERSNKIAKARADAQEALARAAESRARAEEAERLEQQRADERAAAAAAAAGGGAAGAGAGAASRRLGAAPTPAPAPAAGGGELSEEELGRQFKEMLKEKGVTPFSRWDKQLPKIMSDKRFKQVPTQGDRRRLFDSYVRTRADEEKKEKREAVKKAGDGFRALLDEIAEGGGLAADTTVSSLERSEWRDDPRMAACKDKAERASILAERVAPLKREEADRRRHELENAGGAMLKMLEDLAAKRDLTGRSSWTRFREVHADDPRLTNVVKGQREGIFRDFVAGLQKKEAEAEERSRREHEARRRKEREEEEMERARRKAARAEQASSYGVLLHEMVSDPSASWRDWHRKLGKDSQERGKDLPEEERERMFRAHVTELYNKATSDFRALLEEKIPPRGAGEGRPAAAQSLEGAESALGADPRWGRCPGRDRERLWERHVGEGDERDKRARR